MIGLTDQLSAVGNSIVLVRALLGSLAVVAVARLVFAMLNLLPPSALVILFAFLFLIYDTFLVQLVVRALRGSVQDPFMTSALRQAWARVFGDITGVIIGWLFFFSP